jgi:3-oxoacyl-[acyl-carrier-protein] synthase II
MNQVVITGMGVVTPIGNNVSEFAQALRAGTVGIGEISFADINPAWASEKAFTIKNFTPPKYASIHDPHIQYAQAAAAEAIADSGLDMSRIDRGRLGIAVSSSKGGMRTLEKFHDRFYKNPSAILGARVYANLLPNICAQWIARHWKITGPAKPSVAACATGLFDIMEGIRMIEQDEADWCIAGATDASLTKLMLSGYRNMGALSKDVMRPFDKRRDGFLVGEGAGIVILEKEEVARARQARIYGKVLAHTYGFEGSDLIAFSPDGDGLEKCLKASIAKAGIRASDIDYINLHGTATKTGDIYETVQIKKALGKDACHISMSSTKSMVGHMLGASGAVEVVACLVAMRDGFIPPTANLEKQDPALDLDYTPLCAKDKKVNVACSISLGFGGQLGTIVVGK